MKATHPSEDSEALSENWNRGQIQASSRTPESLTDAQGVPKWYAVYTNSRHEKRVEQHLCQREIEHFLPLYRSQRKWNDGSRITLDLPLFPGYLFVHINRTQRVRVLEVPGVLTVVGGTRGDLAALPDAEIDALRLGLAQGKVEPHSLLKVGQRARVRDGAFAGMEGIIERMKYSFRVVLTMNSIMQSFAVEFEGDELELLDSGQV
jgi:transcription antitermination factor NusG